MVERAPEDPRRFGALLASPRSAAVCSWLCAGSSMWLCCSSCGFLTVPAGGGRPGSWGFHPRFGTLAFSWSCPGKHSVQGLIYVLPAELSGLNLNNSVAGAGVGRGSAVEVAARPTGRQRTVGSGWAQGGCARAPCAQLHPLASHVPCGFLGSGSPFPTWPVTGAICII